MLKFEEVPYRRWANGGKFNRQLTNCKEGRRVMAIMGKMMDEGKAVDFRLNPPLSPECIPGEVYDTISLTITD